jgi:hypothetical protein
MPEFFIAGEKRGKGVAAARPTTPVKFGPMIQPFQRRGARRSGDRSSTFAASPAGVCAKAAGAPTSAAITRRLARIDLWWRS